jgi:hypothetical protein
MRARSIAARTAVGALSATAFLTPAAPASAATGVPVRPSDAGTCGRLDTQFRPAEKLNLKVGKPGGMAVTFATERPCALDVWVRPLGQDTGITVGPNQYVPIQTPATFTWTVTGTKKTDDLLVASVQGGGTTLGVRLPDVTVR